MTIADIPEHAWYPEHATFQTWPKDSPVCGRHLLDDIIRSNPRSNPMHMTRIAAEVYRVHGLVPIGFHGQYVYFMHPEPATAASGAVAG